jgi:ABC-2 type transport system ATP-binding protein
VEPIRVSDVRKVYDGTVALDGVDLSVEPATLHCLVGPNGSGKSTIIRLIMGLTVPTEGTVTVPDATLGCGFQRANFYPTLTVAENLDVFGALGADAGAEWRDTVVERLRLGPVLDRPGEELSGGFAKKLDIALALLKRPDFLLLDEPLTDLDDVSERQLLVLLGEYRDAGNAVVVSTHNLRQFESEFDRLSLVYDGRVLVSERRGDVAPDGVSSYHEWYVQRVLEQERE